MGGGKNLAGRARRRAAPMPVCGSCRYPRASAGRADLGAALFGEHKDYLRIEARYFHSSAIGEEDLRKSIHRWDMHLHVESGANTNYFGPVIDCQYSGKPYQKPKVPR